MFISKMLEAYADKYVFMIRKKTPDGAGGFNTVWEEDKYAFDAIRQHDSTVEAQIAEKNGTASTYSFFVDKGITIDSGDVIKNLKTGKVYMITSDGDDSYTPETSGLNMRKVTAKRWELTR